MNQEQINRSKKELQNKKKIIDEEIEELLEQNKQLRSRSFGRKILIGFFASTILYVSFLTFGASLGLFTNAVFSLASLGAAFLSGTLIVNTLTPEEKSSKGKFLSSKITKMKQNLEKQKENELALSKLQNKSLVLDKAIKDLENVMNSKEKVEGMTEREKKYSKDKERQLEELSTQKFLLDERLELTREKVETPLKVIGSGVGASSYLLPLAPVLGQIPLMVLYGVATGIGCVASLVYHKKKNQWNEDVWKNIMAKCSYDPSSKNVQKKLKQSICDMARLEVEQQICNRQLEGVTFVSDHSTKSTTIERQKEFLLHLKEQIQKENHPIEENQSNKQLILLPKKQQKND